MTRLSTRACTAAVLAGLWLLASLACRKDKSETGEREAPVKRAGRVSTNEKGQPVLTVDVETQRRIGLRTQEAMPSRMDTELAAFGRLQEDPSTVFILRAPLAGTIRMSTGREWPMIGQKVDDGATVGSVEPRLAPMDRLTLADRLTAVRAELAASTASLSAARSAYERTLELNADGKNVSDRAVQEAESRLRGEEARVKATGETVRLLESSLAATSPAGSSLALVAARGGEVVEVMTQPGESVEAGQPILRLAKFSTLVARVDVPAGQTISTPVSMARISALGRERTPLQGQSLSAAPSVDPNTQGQAFLFRIANPGGTLRPGLSISAWLRKPGEPRRGAIVPSSAIIRASGKTWLYVQQRSEQFARCEVATDYLPGGRVFVSGAFDSNAKVVTVGAQTLFSEEFKSQIKVGDEGGED